MRACRTIASKSSRRPATHAIVWIPEKTLQGFWDRLQRKEPKSKGSAQTRLAGANLILVSRARLAGEQTDPSSTAETQTGEQS